MEGRVGKEDEKEVSSRFSTISTRTKREEHTFSICESERRGVKRKRSKSGRQCSKEGRSRRSRRRIEHDELLKRKTQRLREEPEAHLLLDDKDLSVELSSLVGGDGGSDDGSGDTTGSSKSGLGGKEDVGDVLVLAEERKVEEDLNGLGV